MLLKIGSKAHQKLVAAVRRRNRRFDAKTKTEQRVAIARDVIEMVKVGKLVADSTYLEVPARVRDRRNSGFVPRTSWQIVARGHEDRDLSEVLDHVPECRACGIGSLFVSAVLRHDQVKFTGRLDDRSEQVEYLSRWFHPEDLRVVEAYFEQGDRGPISGVEIDYDSPIYLCNEDDDRLVMIMENIVSNRGRFNPRRGRHGHRPQSS